jgi:hypothetical protein
MAWRIVKQPNGRYARWSDIVDDFTHMEMTREEAIDVCRGYPGMGAAESEQKVANAEREPWRWVDELATMRELGKRREAERRERYDTA